MERLLVLLSFLTVSAVGLPLSGLQEDVNAVAGLSNRLAARIYQKLAAQQGGNIFISPISISTALAMVFLGARGKTAEEMRNALGYNESSLTDAQVHGSYQSLLQAQPSKEYLLYIANALLTQKDFPIRDEYKDALQKIYNATAQEVDFFRESRKAVQTINDWVKQKTNNQIKKVLDDVNPSTAMVLLNAVYFKGTWKTQFNHNQTTDGVFFNRGLSSQRRKVPMMHLKVELPYAKLYDQQVLELPYKGEDISMYIRLPDQQDGWHRVEQRLSPDMLRDIKGRLWKTKVLLSLPKFKLEYETTLNPVLRDLGMKEVFKSSGNLTGISGHGSLALSKVFHKAVVEVNEEGSEASAITGGIIIMARPELPPPVFVVDHPFLFSIVDKRSDMVLFQGRVSEL